MYRFSLLDVNLKSVSIALFVPGSGIKRLLVESDTLSTATMTAAVAWKTA